MEPTTATEMERLYADSERSFDRWEVVKDLVDEMIDLMLNYRQSGHPGGSRSKNSGIGWNHGRIPPNCAVRPALRRRCWPQLQ